MRYRITHHPNGLDLVAVIVHTCMQARLGYGVTPHSAIFTRAESNCELTVN